MERGNQVVSFSNLKHVIFQLEEQKYERFFFKEIFRLFKYFLPK